MMEAISLTVWRERTPTLAEIQEGMAGNLCRCACYEQITDAILTVAGDGR